MKNVTRREFIRYALVGAAAFSGGAVTNRFAPFLRAPRVGGHYNLAMTEAMVQMVDRSWVYHWAFQDLDHLRPLPQMPGPLVDVIEGDVLEWSITNNLPQEHGFRIPGVPGEVGAGIIISPGETRNVSFLAPPGGSYMYYDHLNEPVNRVLGLHGPLVVLPRSGNTPYSKPSPAIQRLFDDLGASPQFPGEPWKPERTRIWLFNSIDPTFNAMAQRGESIDAAGFRESVMPRYFTINGVSGAYASHDPSIVPRGRIGQPHVIRIMDAGMDHDSLHIHGNHVFILARTDHHTGSYDLWGNVRFVDTYTIDAGGRMDWLLPFIRPPDIPGDPSIPLRDLLRGELSLTLGGVGQSPLAYPMHGHNELSQTAAGGNYPQGAVTHWEITGDVDGVDFPPSDPQEKGSPRTAPFEP